MAYFGLLVATCALVSLSFLSSITNQYFTTVVTGNYHEVAYSGMLRLESFKELVQSAPNFANQSSEDDFVSMLYAYAAAESLNVSASGNGNNNNNTLIASTLGNPRFYTVVQIG